MLKEFGKTMDISCALFALDLFEKKAGSPDKSIGGGLVELFRLVGSMGDKEMRLRAMNLFKRMAETARIYMFECLTISDVMSWLECKFILPMIEGASEHGRLDVCEEIMSNGDLVAVSATGVRAMLAGGSRGDCVSVCQRAIIFGEEVSSNYVESAARYGSLDVFSLIFNQYVATVGLPDESAKCDIEERIYVSSVEKFDCFLSVLRSAGERLGWNVPSPNEILHWAAEYGNAKLCRYAKEKGATDLKLVYSNEISPIDQEVLELGIEWGIDINESCCNAQLKYLVAEYDKSSDPLYVKRENRRKGLDGISKLYHFLHEHGYRHYAGMLEEAIASRSRELIETVVEWGKNYLHEEDEDFEYFNKRRKALPDTPEELAARFPDDPYAKPLLRPAPAA
jgi:hypothetical protein